MDEDKFLVEKKHRNLNLEDACEKTGEFFSAGLHPIL
jgi:hypothetical protein